VWAFQEFAGTNQFPNCPLETAGSSVFTKSLHLVYFIFEELIKPI
jgi:hypothetical protein